MAAPLKHTKVDKFKKEVQGVTMSVVIEAPAGTNTTNLKIKAEELFAFAEKELDPNKNQTDAFKSEE